MILSIDFHANSGFTCHLCRERPVDILALLQFFNRYVLPARCGGSYASISQHLLDELLKGCMACKRTRSAQFLG